MKILALSALALMCSMPALSQSDAPKQDNMKMMGKTMSMTGCVSEKDGKYMMMNKEHPDGVMLMTSDNMKPHVGHQVKVTGMMENGKDNMSMMKMSSMKMMSTTCDPTK